MEIFSHKNPINCLVFFIHPYTYNSDQNCFCTKVVFKYFKHMNQKISGKVKKYIYYTLFFVDEVNKVEANKLFLYFLVQHEQNIKCILKKKVENQSCIGFSKDNYVDLIFFFP